jgi:hypothetical protein
VQPLRNADLETLGERCRVGLENVLDEGGEPGTRGLGVMERQVLAPFTRLVRVMGHVDLGEEDKLLGSCVASVL